MAVLRRPLLLVFVCLAALICIWYGVIGTGEPTPTVREPVQCVGRIEEIQDKASGRVVVLADTRVVNEAFEEISSDVKMVIHDVSEQDLFEDSRPGNQIRVSGTFCSFERAGNPGQFDEYAYYRSMGISGRVFADEVTVLDARSNRVQSALQTFRRMAVERLFDVMDEGDAGMLSAMLLGDKSYLPEEEKELYQRTGIGHVLVVSGLHISLLAAGVFFFLRSYVMPMRWSVVATALFLLAYGQFTGFQVAAFRAVLMMCCALFARYTGRVADPLSALSLSGIVTLVQQPTQLFQCGFLLSYTAVFGIALFHPAMERANLKSTWAKSLAFSASVFAVTLPVMLWFYYEICPYSVLVNLVLLPFLSLLIGVGAAGCCLAFFFPAAGGFVLATVHYLLEFYESVCRLVSELPMSRIVTGRPPVWGVVLYYTILLAAVCLYLREGNRRWVCAGAAALFAACLFFRQNIHFLYAQLDVGQGDCACVFYGGRTVLIDGGSSSETEIGKYTIQKFLKYYGRTRVDCAFISHSDSDHTSGLLELVENGTDWGVSVDGVVLPDIRKKDENYVLLLRTFERKGIPVKMMKKGDCLSDGGLTVTCLHPFPEYEWESENDYSLTLELSYEDVRILSTGDLEESGEMALEGLVGSYDLLKVGHHGSKTSTSSGFIRQVSPAHAVISAGRNNRYGHPAAETLDQLKKVGAHVWNTMEGGAFFLRREGGRKWVHTYREKE